MSLVMDGTRKRFFPVIRKQGLSREEMAAYWSTTHARLVAGTAGIREGRRSYIQNHLTEPGPGGGGAFRYDGIAEFVLGTPTDVPLPPVAPSDYQRIKADERNVFDTGKSIGLTAIENVVVPGRSACKLIVLARRLPGMSPQAYSEHWRAHHVDIILGQADFRSHLRGYVQNHTVPGSAKYLNGEAVTDADAFDGIAEMWFDSVEAAHAAFSSDGYRSLIRTDESAFTHTDRSISHFVREVVVFNETAL